MKKIDDVIGYIFVIMVGGCLAYALSIVINLIALSFMPLKNALLVMEYTILFQIVVCGVLLVTTVYTGILIYVYFCDEWRKERGDENKG